MISGLGLGNLFEKDQALVGLEIGCSTGDTAEHLLETYPNLTLHTIDPYTDYLDWNGNYLHGRKNLYKHIVSKFSKYGERFILHKTYSDLIVDKFQDDMFDFIFVDGLHTYDQVLKDCKNYYPKVKEGGYMTGHDYQTIKEVNKAVNEFAEIVNKEILITLHDVWYWKK